MTDVCALIVDDDRSIRALLTSMFKRYGILFDEAEDGEAAIERLRHKQYSVVLLDLMMPKVDGLEVLEFMKGEQVPTPVVVISAASPQVLDRIPTDAVVKGVIRKPFDLIDVTTTVLTACGRPIPESLREK